MSSHSGRAPGLWADYRMAVTGLDAAARELNDSEVSTLGDFLAARHLDLPVVSRYISMSATVNIRSGLIGLILQRISRSATGKPALFAALGSVGARRVRPELAGFVELICSQDSADSDHDAILDLLWSYRKFDLVGRLLSWLLAYEDPFISATARDFLDDHAEAGELVTGQKVGTLSVAGRADAPVLNSAVNREPPASVKAAWSSYCDFQVLLSNTVRQVRMEGVGDMAQKVSAASDVAPCELGRFLALTAVGEPSHVTRVIAGKSDEFTRGILEGIATEVSVNAECVVNMVIDMPRMAVDSGLVERLGGIRRSIRSVYGEFDRFGWLTNPRE